MSLPDRARLTLWMRQTLAVARLELRKLLRARRLIGLVLLNLAPVVILALTHLLPSRLDRGATATFLSSAFAGVFSVWMLRVAVFFTSAALAVQLWRTELLEKTLHYYLLAPVARPVVVAGKFLAASCAAAVITGCAVLSSYLLLFAWLGGELGAFMFDGPGLAHLLAYLGVTVLGCIGYGAVFALLGLLVRNPIIPALALFGWESILFLMPPFLKHASVLFYLQSLLPVRPADGPFAMLAEAPPALASIAGMAVFVLAVLALAGWRASRMEIAYSTD